MGPAVDDPGAPGAARRATCRPRSSRCGSASSRADWCSTTCRSRRSRSGRSTSPPRSSATPAPPSATGSPRTARRSRTSPITSRRWGSGDAGRARLDLRVRPRRRRGRADSRRPVQRGRVRRPRRLGAQRPDAHARARDRGRRRSPGDLPPRPRTRRRHARRASSRTRARARPFRSRSCRARRGCGSSWRPGAATAGPPLRDRPAVRRARSPGPRRRREREDLAPHHAAATAGRPP